MGGKVSIRFEARGPGFAYWASVSASLAEVTCTGYAWLSAVTLWKAPG